MSLKGAVLVVVVILVGWFAPAPGTGQSLRSTLAVLATPEEPRPPFLRFRVRVTRGRDLGQPFGSLFQATSADGSLTVGAGFANNYNTRLRGDRHAVQFYVRDNNGPRAYSVTPLPRPNSLCGTYLHARDEQLFSTFGGLRVWNQARDRWDELPDPGGTAETMRVGDQLLEFGESRVRFADRVILDRPDRGEYQMFFYANGHLCFYHVDRGTGGYRAYTHDDDGFSRLIACPWTPDDDQVDLDRAVVFNLPVVGETTFAWGVLGDQIVTGSNIGGFYCFANGTWRMLRQPDLTTSFQLYSSLAYHNELLMGQYPTGRLFAYDGKQLVERAGWPPSPEGYSPHAREAQTTNIYAGDLVVGIWPWGELWRMDDQHQRWSLARRMFDHPEPRADRVHPYEEENQQDAVPNLWGQRITSLLPLGSDLIVSTSAKAPVAWNPTAYPFLAPDKWEAYGMVYRLFTPGHLSATTQWTDGPTEFVFTISPEWISIEQDGVCIGRQALHGEASSGWSSRSFADVQWGVGVFGPASGTVRGVDER